LLAILRLSTALARLRLSNEVINDDVAEAIRLVEKSRDSVKPEMGHRVTRGRNPIDEISNIVRRLQGALPENQKAIPVKDIRERCTQAGFTAEQVDRCLEDYENLNVWHINQNRTKLTYV
jgi:DNA replication licensing factor MCM7